MADGRKTTLRCSSWIFRITNLPSSEVIANRLGDGLPDDHHMDDQQNSKRNGIEWSFANRRQRNYDKTHDQVHENPKERSRYDRVVDQKRQDPAGRVKNSRSHQRNEKVERKAQECDSHPSLERIGPQDAAGDELKKAHEITFGQGQCGETVENAAK